MSPFFQQLLEKEELFFVLVITTAILISSLAKTIGSTIRSVNRERTRREIAAYIAEGSMTPEQGERIMAAEGRRDASC